jgi:hypothetical protein
VFTLLSACSVRDGTAALPNAQSAVPSSREQDVEAAETAIPAFFVGQTRPPIENGQSYYGVVEYARNAGLNSKPLRSLRLRGNMFGVDSSGNIFTSNVRSGVGCVGEGGGCVVYVTSPAGARLRSLFLANPYVEPAFLGVDKAGQVYVGNTTTSEIDVYAAGAKGAAKPLRTMTFAGIGNPINADYGFFSCPVPLAVDAKGNIYFMGSVNGSTSQLVEFAPGKSGLMKPSRRIVSNKVFGGAQGIGAAGNIWTVDANRGPRAIAYLFGPADSGRTPPRSTVALPASTTALTMDSSGDAVYVTRDYGCSIQVVAPHESVPKQVIDQHQSSNACKLFIAVTF